MAFASPLNGYRTTDRMRYQLLIPIALLIASCGKGTAVPEPVTVATDTNTSEPLAQYRQLIGSWMDSTTSTDHTCYEHWVADGDTAITGLGHVIAEGDTVFIEHLRMSMVNGHVFYAARVGSQNNGTWVPFAAQPTGRDTLMFENAEHDFPQCITYAKNNRGGWDVDVTGNEDGKVRSEHYHFRER